MKTCDRPVRSSLRTLGCVLLIACAAGAEQRVSAQAGAERPAVLRGVEFLKRGAANLWTGEAAIVALTLNKAEVLPTDPALASCVQKIMQRFGDAGYAPERDSAPGIYEASVTLLALANIDAVGYKPYIEHVMRWLVSQQKASGGWDYTERTAGDASITQYAILGLWEAEGAGVTVPPAVWDNTAAWFISVQYPDGGWKYHHDEAQWQETVSMTAAGVGSLLVCQRQLARYRRGFDSIHPLMTPLVPEGTGPLLYRPKTSAAEINSAVRKGISWLSSNFDLARKQVMGQSNYYGLYGIERIGALADRQTLGGVDWYARGQSYILGNQGADGSWKDYHGDVPNTCWAILFVVKATEKSVQKIEIRRLGGGTLLGGRGLPSDLNNLTIAQGRVVVRPMSGAVESMIAVLEDPRALAAESALGGLVERYRAEGPKVIRPHKNRFLKMLTDRDPSIRRVAAWALGRTEELDVVPLLIRLLDDPVEDVMAEARQSLQFLSRKVDGYGPPVAPTPEQRAEAIRAWREWYAGARPAELDVDLEVTAEPAAATGSAPAAKTSDGASAPASEATPGPRPAEPKTEAPGAPRGGTQGSSG